MSRFVIFAEKYGVYLGDGIWSMGGRSSERNSAPTFEEGQLTQVLNSLPKELGLETREIIPDMAGFQASMNKCAEIGLPRWGKDGAPKPADKETVKGSMGEETPTPKKKKGKKL